MEKKSALLSLIPASGILPLFFHEEVSVCCNALRALYQAGVRAFEYVDRGEAAFANFTAMRALCDDELRGMYLGIGTIKTAACAQKYLEAGADFIVSPGMVDEVAVLANHNNMLYIPGCMTPTEIIRAESLGLVMIKLFPGNTLGPGFVEAIRAVFPAMLFMPTGGVDLDEASMMRWFASGVCALGGSKMITRAMLDGHQYDELTRQMTAVLALAKHVQTK